MNDDVLLHIFRQTHYRETSAMLCLSRGLNRLFLPPIVGYTITMRTNAFYQTSPNYTLAHVIIAPDINIFGIHMYITSRAAYIEDNTYAHIFKCMLITLKSTYRDTFDTIAQYVSTCTGDRERFISYVSV